MMRVLRRTFLVAAATLALAACNGQADGAAQGDMTKGDPNAPVKIVEYASVTCGHCAAWNEQVWPQLKAKYVDTGLVHYEFRELPTPPQPVAVAGFLVARCAGPDKYFEIVDFLMRNQQTLVNNPRATLRQVGRSAGMTDEQVDQCVTDEAAVAALNERAERARRDNVTGTPSFLINGKKADVFTLEQFDAALQPLLAERR